MATKIEDLLITFSADTARLVRGVDQVNKKLSSFEKRTKQATSLLKKFAAVAAGAFFANLGRSLIAAADEMAKFSRTVGLTVKELSTLEFSAARSGVSISTLRNSLSLLSKNTADAVDGLGEATRAFDKLGIDAKQFAQLGIPEQFEQLADAIMGVQTVSERVQIARAIFGRGGQDILQLLEGGSEGLRRYAAMAERLGITLDELVTGPAEKFQDQLGDLQLTMRVFGTRAFAPILEPLGDFFDLLRDAVISVLPGVETFMKGMGDALQALVPIAESAISVFTALIGVFDKLWKTIAGIFGVDSEGLVAEIRELFDNLVELFVDVAVLVEGAAKLLGLQIEAFGRVIEGDIKGALVTFERANLAITQAFQKAAKENTRDLFIPPDVDTKPLEVKVTYTQEPENFGQMVKDEMDAAVKAWEDWVRAVADAEGSVQSFIDAQERNIRLMDSTISATERFWLENHKLAESIELIAEKDEERARQMREIIELNQEVLEAEKARQEAMEKAADIGREVGQVIVSAFEEAIFAGEKFSDVLKAVAEDLLRLGTRKLISEPIIEAFGRFVGNLGAGQTGAGGGPAASGGGILATIGGFLGGILGFQEGGIPRIGRPALVGEDGPELFLPSVSGAVIPNDVLDDIMTSGVVINFNVVTPDANSFRQSQSQILADLGRAVNNATRRMR